MARPPIRWILVRAFVHATEDEERVLGALDAACPGGETRREILEGQHGNPLIHLLRRTEDGKEIRAAWAIWDRDGILGSLGERLDDRIDEEGILHFRLDKQRAYLGKASLARSVEGDTLDVQVKVEAYPARPDEIRRVARALLTGAV